MLTHIHNYIVVCTSTLWYVTSTSVVNWKNKVENNSFLLLPTAMLPSSYHSPLQCIQQSEAAQLQVTQLSSPCFSKPHRNIVEAPNSHLSLESCTHHQTPLNYHCHTIKHIFPIFTQCSKNRWTLLHRYHITFTNTSHLTSK